MKTRISKGQPDVRQFNTYPELAQISVAFMQDDTDFVAQWFFPWVGVEEKTGKYPVFSRSAWARNGMAKRSDGERSAAGGFDVVYQDFNCDVWAEHTKQGSQVRANARLVDLDRAAVSFLTEQAKLSLEVEFLDTYFKAGVWQDLTGVTSNPGADEFLSWADSDAQPINDLKKAIRRGRVNGGKRANSAIIDEETWDVVSQHPNVISLVNQGQTTGMAQVTPEALAAYLRLSRGIRIAGAVETTSAEGVAEASATYSYAAPNGVLLGYVTSSPMIMEPSAGYHFGWRGYLGGAANEFGAAFRRWYEDGPDAFFYEVQQARDLHQVAPDLAVFLATPLAT